MTIFLRNSVKTTIRIQAPIIVAGWLRNAILKNTGVIYQRLDRLRLHSKWIFGLRINLKPKVLKQFHLLVSKIKTLLK